MKSLLLTILVFVFSITSAQQNTENDLDFWIGEWTVEWKDTSGITHTGTNKIEKILNGKVIQENFSAEGFNGKSFSVFHPMKKIWQQTWVDNNSGYMVFEGGKDNDNFILSMQREVKGKIVLMRMVFNNITKDGFNWDWQMSSDNGETWKDQWNLVYKRK